MNIFTKIWSLIRLVSPRRWVQTGTLLAANAYYLSFLRFIPCSFLNCSNCPLSTFSCPLILIQRGAVIMSMGLFGGAMLWKLLGSVIAATAILMLFGAALGTWTCGWLCPFGFFQDLLHKIPVKKFHLPHFMGWFRLPIFLGVVVAAPYLTRKLFFCDLCPEGAIVRFTQQAAGIPLFLKGPEGMLAIASIAILVLTITLAIFIYRPFCTVLCPIGGVYGLFNKFSGLFIKVDKDSCKSCNLCTKKCPQGLDPYETPNHNVCNRCLDCTDSCDSIKTDIRL
jgi:polyferredoxin